MSFKEALFGFTNEPVNDVGSNHKVAATTLKVECWISLIGAGLVTVLGVLFALAALVGGAFVGDFIESMGWWDSSSEAGAAAGAFLFVAILFFTVVAVALMGLWLWWANTTYRVWNNVDDNAITWVNVFGAVMLLFSIGGFVNIATGDFTGGTNIIGLVIGLLIIIFANMANSQGELNEASTVNDAADAA